MTGWGLEYNKSVKSRDARSSQVKSRELENLMTCAGSFLLLLLLVKVPLLLPCMYTCFNGVLGPSEEDDPDGYRREVT